MADRSKFLHTRWSLIAALRGGDPAQARVALGELCRDYWYPLYAFVRRLGHRPEDAADLTQGFFAYLMETGALARADPERGRLRTFLLTALQNYIRGEWRREQRHSGHAGSSVLAIDRDLAERSYGGEPTETVTPESLYHRRWALTLLERALHGVEGDYARQGKSELFKVLKPALVGEVEGRFATTYGVQLGMTAGAVRVAICRLRSKYRDRLRAEVAASMEPCGPAELDEELAALFRALS